MIRLHIIVEGHTEQRFVERTLVQHLGRLNVFADASCITTRTDTKRGIKHKGGLPGYAAVKNFIGKWLKQDKAPECRFTTMIDLYPSRSKQDFPGFQDAMSKRDKYEMVEVLEKAIKDDINDDRFIPYLQLHEFEALILAAPEHLIISHPDYEKEIGDLTVELADANPELINDNYDTCPSRRIIKIIPEYESSKNASGSTVAGEIGLDKLREKCQHFDEWLTTLEGLGRLISA